MKYNIQSFPTIKFFPKGGEPIEYGGGRQEADFVEFLNEKCGTYRAVGGGLNDQVCIYPFIFQALSNQLFRLVVIPSSMYWLANFSLQLALPVIPFIRKHLPLLRKSVLPPRTTYG